MKYPKTQVDKLIPAQIRVILTLYLMYLPVPGLVVPDDKLPEFTDEVDNRTVVAGREAILSCHVESLGSYKVGVSPQHC